MYRWLVDVGEYGVCRLTIHAQWDQPGEVLLLTHGQRCGGRVNFFLEHVMGLDMKQPITPHQLHDALMSQTEETGMIAVGPQTQPRRMAKVTLVDGEIPQARQAA